MTEKIFSFLVFKGIIFITPIFALFLSSQDYYVIESVLALAIPIAAFVSFGVPNYLSIKAAKEKNFVGRYFLLAKSFYISILLFLSSVICYLISENLIVSSAILAIGCLVLQFNISCYYKGSGLGQYAVRFESMLYISILAYVLVVLSLSSASLFVFLIVNYFFVTLFYFNIFGTEFFLRQSSISFSDLVSLMKKTGMVTVYSAVMLFAIAFPRLYLAYNEDVIGMTKFASNFRICSIAILVNQFLLTMFFKRLVNSHSKNFKKVVLLVPLIVFFFALISNFSGVWVMRQFGVSSISITLIEVLLMALSVSMWSLMSLLETRIYALEINLTGVTTMSVVFPSAVVALTFYKWGSLTTLNLLFCWLFLLILLIAFQLIAIRRVEMNI